MKHAKHAKHAPLALAALVAAPLALHAQQEEQSWTEIEDEALMVKPLGMTVGELDGASVYDSAGERIGELDDILMGADGSSMAASLDVGGFLGMGEKDVAIPVTDLAPAEDGFTVNMTQEELEAMPEFED